MENPSSAHGKNLALEIRKNKKADERNLEWLAGSSVSFYFIIITENKKETLENVSNAEGGT